MKVRINAKSGTERSYYHGLLMIMITLPVTSHDFLWH